MMQYNAMVGRTEYRLSLALSSPGFFSHMYIPHIFRRNRIRHCDPSS